MPSPTQSVVVDFAAANADWITLEEDNPTESGLIKPVETSTLQAEQNRSTGFSGTGSQTTATGKGAAFGPSGSTKVDRPRFDQPDAEPGVRVYASGPYTLISSAQALPRLDKGGLVETIDETLVFGLADRGSLQKIPKAGVEMAWIGRPGPVPAVAGQDVILPLKTVGILRCRYQAVYDRWVCPRPHEIVVVGQCGEAVASLDLKPDASSSVVGGESTGDVSGVGENREGLQFTVTNHCTGEPLEGAVVACAGKSGVTDKTGQVTLPPIGPGKWMVSASHPDTMVNTEDGLDNEWIVITSDGASA